MSHIDAERWLYHSEFAEQSDFEGLLFEHCRDYIRTVQIDGKPVSMLFELPVLLELPGKRVEGSYLFAFVTEPSHRGNGYITALVKACMTKDFLCLKLSNPAAAPVYEKIGFRRMHAVKDTKLPIVRPKGGFLTLSQAFGLPEKKLGEAYELMVYAPNIDMDKVYFSYIYE